MGLLQFVRKRRTWTNVTRCIILLMAVLHNCRHVVQHCWVQMSAKLIMRQLLRMRMHLIRTVRMIKAVRCRQHIPMTHSMNLIVLLCNWIHFPNLSMTILLLSTISILMKMIFHSDENDVTDVCVCVLRKKHMMI